MSKLRLLFIKEGPAAYISLLDLLRSGPFPGRSWRSSTATGIIRTPSSPLSCPCRWGRAVGVSCWISR